MRLNYPTLGPTGVASLVLSSALALATLGAGLGYLCWRVYRQGKMAPTEPSGHFDLLLLPGAALADDAIQPVYQARLDRGITLYRGERVKSILLMGGCTPGNTLPESTMAASYLYERGVPNDDVMLETHSQHTLENFVFAKKVVDLKRQRRLLLVSSRLHLYRCVVFAANVGLSLLPCAAEDNLPKHSALWKRLFIEGAYLHWFYTQQLCSKLAEYLHLRL